MMNRDPQDEHARLEYGNVMVSFIDSFNDDCIGHIYPDLLSDLYDIPFVCRVKLDENRVADALSMRDHIIQSSGDKAYYNATFPNPSVLEVLCAFAKLCWESDGQSTTRYPSDWLRMFFRNMNLIDEYGNYVLDEHYNFAIDNKLYTRTQVAIMMDRRYDRNGEHGGLFHVNNPNVDMSRIQLFEQMDIYLGEQDSE